MLAAMSGVPYDPEHIARFYNEYGVREWERFDVSAMDRVGLEVHLRLLREHIRDGDRVLDAGAGPGRFTLELARLGARVVVGDISPTQLELHAEKTSSVEGSIESRELLDITDLGRFPDGSFDAFSRSRSRRAANREPSMVARTSSLLSSDPKTDASVPTGSSRLKGHSCTLGQPGIL
jgi:SAM-dependent methyltransferase